jgi:hypothetical protein
MTMVRRKRKREKRISVGVDGVDGVVVVERIARNY